MTFRHAVIFLLVTLGLNWFLHLSLMQAPPPAAPVPRQTPEQASPVKTEPVADPRPPAIQDWKHELRAKLKRRVTIELNHEPLGAGLAQLREQGELQTVLSPNIGTKLELRATLRLRDVEANTALTWLTRLAGLDFGFKDFALWIGPPGESSRATLETFETPWHLTGGDAKDLIENRLLVHEFCDKAGSSVDEQNGMLLVVNTPETHERVAGILRALHEQWDKDVISFSPINEAAHAALKQQLARKVSCTFTHVAFAEALASLDAGARFNVALDTRKAADWTRTPVSLALKDVPLQHALEQLAKQANAAWTIKDEAVFFTSEYDPVMMNELRIYRLDNVIRKLNDDLRRDPRNARDLPAATAQHIGDMLRMRIRPDLWDAALGTSIEEKGGRLLVMQRAEVHEAIERMLKSLETGAYLRRLPGQGTKGESDRREF